MRLCTGHPAGYSCGTHFQRGFNIVELMVVLAIISILAVIALPVYQDYATRAKVSEGLNAAGGLQTQVAEFYNTNQYFPKDGSEFAPGQEATASFFTGNYVEKITIEECEIVVTFNLGITSRGNTLRVKPWYDSGLYIWSYDNEGGIESDWLPSSTRNLLMSPKTPPTDTAKHCCGEEEYRNGNCS